MADSISATTAEQTQAVVMQMMAMTQQKIQGDISLQLIQAAVNTGQEWQDPSTVTPEQLQSPVDIRV